MLQALTIIYEEENMEEYVFMLSPNYLISFFYHYCRLSGSPHINKTKLCEKKLLQRENSPHTHFFIGGNLAFCNRRQAKRKRRKKRKYWVANNAKVKKGKRKILVTHFTNCGKRLMIWGSGLANKSRILCFQFFFIANCGTNAWKFLWCCNNNKLQIHSNSFCSKLLFSFYVLLIHFKLFATSSFPQKV